MSNTAQLEEKLKICFTQGQWAEAESLCLKLISLNPGRSDFTLKLVKIRAKQERFEESLQTLEPLFNVEPKADLYALKGQILALMGRNDEALKALETALSQGSHNAEVHYLYGLLTLDLGKLNLAWPHLIQAWKLQPENAYFGSVALFHSLAYPKIDDTQRAELYKNWANQYLNPLTPAQSHFKNAPDPKRRLRIGFVSGDFCSHAVNTLLLPLFEKLDRDPFEIFAYAQIFRKRDEKTALFQKLSDHWLEIQNLSSDQVFQIIQSDQIDILIDCSGHTEGERLEVFAKKPAPVQITGFGFVFTTGLKAIDYLFSDPIAIPPERESLFAERILPLPSQLLWYPSSSPIQQLELTPLPCESNGFITFGSGNRLFKLNETVIKLWSKLLKKIPQSRLVLKSKEFDQAWIRQVFQENFASQGISPDRLRFYGKTALTEHLKFYNEIDIALDPFPYNGGITSCEALYMGVPVIVLNDGALRTGPSLLTLTGIPELLAKSPEDYLKIATELANNRDLLRGYRQNLRTQLLNSPVADTQGFVSHVSSALRTAWQTWCHEQRS
ncbi:hypothetical protein COW36_20360 [bacterium (Candidatus Blackallbacteria) CG17_big_fil_post_rev_8_21_14_2_50_48_46]|uniref:protein O-GlcNAc transferase n=1 Tax=bacterium (Candidatus Blackallbacteria) CG17_big_fil_post_rev_8_21_14_2_50_48_46 TaxID=2014261 RepID=A0A2M7FZQ1_9BACT|nr:MAG: hypothetical protein COW64_22685 [bacterium (Candidatus Blackallbacteria) CG18_big_fil_WC_8_21_14_2_50_49_26]PIW14758.1 MAG: hypothetical protein COW36_20360 [bacterium (Candidatus Blackallbacteria) CG17_big_fil_post_rev_8_21_14_2_50_48_46]PIW50860.1 MAG: hypothetical protein COW20_01175 [bacterium (Candidatus Blackallbacteria) CG13_big_fil_rev_8_21_14_2_50_49_14]